MHDLVVRQRQDEVLAEGVEQRERELVVVVAPVDRVLLEVVEHVVHPAHVPLEAEAEPAEVGRPRHRGHAVDSSAIIMHARVVAVDRPR